MFSIVFSVFFEKTVKQDNFLCFNNIAMVNGKKNRSIFI